MSNSYERIILVTDGSSNSRSAEETAFNLAKQNTAKVLIVDTAQSPSFVSQIFNSSAGDVFDMVATGKEKRLEELAGRFNDGGIEAAVEVLVGNSSEQIAKKAIEWNASLVVRYMKGVRSRNFSPFGNTARNLMRVCPCPLLLVGDKAIESPRVLACINAEHGKAENQAILSEATRLAGSEKKLRAVYCWEFLGGESLQEHLTDELFTRYLLEAQRNYEGLFQQFLETHDLSAFQEGARLERGHAVDVIPQHCKKENVDVAVMSSASQDHPLTRLLGSTIESVLDKLPSSLLVVKPEGFESPLKSKVEADSEVSAT